jgi:hypothetical protein
MINRERIVEYIIDEIMEGDAYLKYLDYYWDNPGKLERDINTLKRMLAEVRRLTIFRSRKLDSGAGALGRMVYLIFAAALEVSEKLLGTAEEDLERLITTGSLEM